MSRSRKKVPVCGLTTADSEKWYKRWWHRRYRRKERRAIQRDDELMPHFREVSNPWLAPKDGKFWHVDDGDDFWDIARILRK
jgi:hypothetical protein